MKLETIVVADLKPLQKNVRFHTETQVREFVRSLEQFGQTRPFVIDEENNILVGNCMHKAMIEAGIKTAVAYRMSSLSKAQKKKLVLSDNRIFALGGDDSNSMEDYLREIGLSGDLDIAGFDESVIQELIRDTSEIEKSIMSYGTASEAFVNNVQKQAEKTPESAAAQTEQVKSAQASAIETAKTIVCPSCGEVIRLVL